MSVNAEMALTCPRCQRPKKLYVNVLTLKNFCFYCRSTFSRRDAKDLLDGKKVATSSALAQAVQGHSVSQGSALVPAWSVREARKYLGERLLREEDCPAVMYSPAEKMLYFQIWSPAPEFGPAWHRRTILPNKKPAWFQTSGTKRQHYFYGPRPQQTKRVLLVEGIVDACRVGPPALSLLGTQPSETHYAYLYQFEEVLVWMDPDAAGDKCVKDFLEWGAQEGVAVRQVEFRARSIRTGKVELVEPGDVSPADPRLHEFQKSLRKGLLHGFGASVR